MEKVKIKEKIGYGLGDAASSIFWKLFSMYLLFFYTDIFGLPAAAVGTMFLITRIWDSFFDPVVGVISDRTETKWGKFRPYLLWMVIPFGVMGVLTFTTPSFGASGKMIYAYVSYSVMMMVYSLINVPYASLLGVMSSDPKTRTSLSSYRMIFAFAGSILVLMFIEPFVDMFSRINTVGSEPNLALGWQLSVAVFAVIVAVMFLCTFLWTKERVKPIKETKNTFKDDFRDLWENRPWWILMGAGVMALIFNSVRDGAAVFYFKYYVESKEMFSIPFLDSSWTLTSIYLVLGQIANIIGILFVTPVSNRIGKKKTYFGAMAMAAILSVCFYFIPKDGVWTMMLFQVLISICAGSIFPLLWSMYADISDFSEWKTGRRATGLVFSASSMSQKLGWTIGGALTGWLLGFYGFQANVEQTETVQNGIRLMLSLLPAIGAIFSVILILLYPLTENKLKDITESLAKRRG